MSLPLNINNDSIRTIYIIKSITPPTNTVLRLNIDEREIDHPKMIKKNVLITNADSPVITLKSARTLFTLS